MKERKKERKKEGDTKMWMTENIGTDLQLSTF